MVLATMASWEEKYLGKHTNETYNGKLAKVAAHGAGRAGRA